MKTIAFKHDFEIYSNRLTNVVNQSEQDTTQNLTSSNIENIGVDGKDKESLIQAVQLLVTSDYLCKNHTYL